MEFEIDIGLIKSYHLSILNICEHIVSLIIDKKNLIMSLTSAKTWSGAKRGCQEESIQELISRLSIMFDDLHSSTH